MKINSILSSKKGGVITIHPEQSLAEAVALLTEHDIGALVAVDEHNKLKGILSERDIIRVMSRRANALALSVDEVMTRKVVVGLPQDDVMSVANTMTEKRFRHLPIVEGDKLIGIVSIGDVLKAQRDQYLGEIDTLETQILAED
ncbi:MAG: CBS domain-containing protein [Candidatus Promineifilaceae bacterium]